MRAKMGFFALQSSTIDADVKKLEEILFILKKLNPTNGYYFYKYAISTAGWITWGAGETYWLATEINAFVNPVWKISDHMVHGSDRAWNAGHADQVNYTHWDCSEGGHLAQKHKDGSLEFACMAGPVSTCCDQTNGTNYITAIGVIGLFIGYAGNCMLKNWACQYSDSKMQPIDIPETQHSKITQLIQEDILDKYIALPLSKQPTSTEKIHKLTQILEQFSKNPVAVDVLNNLTNLIQQILSDMQKTKLPLSIEVTDEDSSEHGELLKNYSYF